LVEERCFVLSIERDHLFCYGRSLLALQCDDGRAVRFGPVTYFLLVPKHLDYFGSNVGSVSDHQYCTSENRSKMAISSALYFVDSFNSAFSIFPDFSWADCGFEVTPVFFDLRDCRIGPHGRHGLTNKSLSTENRHSP